MNTSGSATAQDLINRHYAPGRFQAESFAVAHLPWGAELPDWSEDEWDGVLTFSDGEVVTLVYYRLAAVEVQLTLW